MSPLGCSSEFRVNRTNRLTPSISIHFYFVPCPGVELVAGVEPIFLGSLQAIGPETLVQWITTLTGKKAFLIGATPSSTGI